MKGRKFFSWLLAAFFVVAISGYALAEVDKGPEVLKFETKKKGTITFKHHKHQEKFKCGECHHSKGDDGKQKAYVEGQKIEKCEVCHTKEMENKKLRGRKGAMHTNCKGCHKKMKKGPKKCKECHVK